MAWDPLADEIYRNLADLARERRVILERLARIEESRTAVKEAVYSRVKAEYDARMAESDCRMMAGVDTVALKLRGIVEALPGALRKVERADEEIQEVEFRHSLGEFTDLERQNKIAAIRGDVAEGVAVVEDGLPMLKAYGELLGDLFPQFVVFLEAERSYSSGTAIEATQPIRPLPVCPEPSSPKSIPGIEPPAPPTVFPEPPSAPALPVATPSTPPAEAPRPETPRPDAPIPSPVFRADVDDLLDEEDFEALDRLDAELMQGPCVDEQSLLREVEGISEADLMDIENLGRDLEGKEGAAQELAAFENPFSLSNDDEDDPDSESLIEESGDLGISLTGLLSPYALSEGHKPSLTPPDHVKPSGPPVKSGPPVLVKFSEDGTNQEFPLGAEEIAVGRAADNDIVLLDKTVSRHHALISRESCGFVITDLNSTKGTFINGRREASKTLVDGDEILIGTMTFKVRIPR